MSEYAFKAFVSYSHTDERWAQWLHRALETYRLPRALQTKLNLPARPLAPVFRDRDELSVSTDLSATIRAELAQSENLIVLCSRAAANSDWVNAEIEAFTKLGRNDNIYCVLVDDATLQECLPAAIDQLGGEPLVADVYAEKRNNAKLRLIAGMLGVGYDDLRRRDATRRRNQTLGSAAVSILVLSAVSLVTYQVATEPPCTNSAALFEETWNETRAQSIRSAVLGTGLPFGEHTMRIVIETLSDYADRWIETHQEACTATLVRGEQSEQLMDLRMACLLDRQNRFEAFSQQLETGDFETTRNAVRTVKNLPLLSRCSDQRALTAAFPPPPDTIAEEVARTRSDLAELEALVDASVVKPAKARAEEVWSQTERLDYPPVQAEALVLLGRTQALDGDKDAAQSTFVRAASVAVTANDSALAAEAWLGIPPLVLETPNGTSQALDMLGLAKAYVEMLPLESPLRARYHALLGRSLILEGKIEPGVGELNRAIELARTYDDPNLPRYLHRLARTHALHLEHAAALPLALEAIALSRSYFGEAHPAYARALQTYGGMHIDIGDTETAIANIEKGLHVQIAAFPEGHPQLAATYAQLGSAYRNAGNPQRAEELLKTSLQIYEKVEEASPLGYGDAHNNLGNVYTHLGRFEEAERHLREAARLYESIDFYFYSIALHNIGVMNLQRGHFAAALPDCEKALQADEAQFESDSPNIAYPLTCVGEALVGLGRFEEAVTVLSRAYEIRVGRHEPPVPMADTRFNLARALWETDGNREDIRAHYQFALKTVIEHDTGDADKLRAWAEGKDL